MVFVLSPAWDKEKNSEFQGGIEPKTFEFCAPMRNEQCLLRSAYMTRVLGLIKFWHISSLLHASARYVFCMFTLATVINIRRISGFLVKNCAPYKAVRSMKNRYLVTETRGWKDRSKEFPSRSKLPQFFSLQLNPDITISRATSRRRKNVRNMSRHDEIAVVSHVETKRLLLQ